MKNERSSKRFRFRIYAALVVIIVIVGSVFAWWYTHPSPQSDHSPKDIFANDSKVIPVINGKITNGEWDDTQSYSYTWSSGEQTIVSDTYHLVVLFKHNSTKLFMLFQLSGKENDFSEIKIKFDNRHDGRNTIDDQIILIYLYANSFDIAPFAGCPTPPHSNYEPVNATFDGKQYTAEFAMNLTRLIPINGKVGIGLGIAQSGVTKLFVPEGGDYWNTWSDYPDLHIEYQNPTNSVPQKAPCS